MCFQLHDDLRTYGTEHAFDCQRRRLLAMDKNFIQTVKKTFFVVIFSCALAGDFWILGLCNTVHGLGPRYRTWRREDSGCGGFCETTAIDEALVP